jgi:DNA-binding NarL/FixJ family response regulator
MDAPVSALIAACPGPLRDSLHFFLDTLPEIGRILLADDTTDAIATVQHMTPALVLLDTRLPGSEPLDVLKTLRTLDGKRHCLVLADDVIQQQSAADSGADASLLKGYDASKLIATIKEWLKPPSTA